MVIGLFEEQSSVACPYRGELLGLLAIHLILLAVNKVESALQGKVEIYSECLSACNRISTLTESRIPSRCSHADILKTIMINCQLMIFTMTYLHVKAHQDNLTSMLQLLRPA